MRSARTIEKLLKDPLVIAIEESRPSGSLRLRRVRGLRRVKETYQAEARPLQEKGAGALVAIIDDGIDVLHEAFLDDAGGRGSSASGTRLTRPARPSRR